MRTGPFDNYVWDEHTWEKYIDELEDQTRRLRRLITPHGIPYNPRWLFLMQNYESDTEVVDTFVIEELIFEEAYFGNEDGEDAFRDQDVYYDDELKEFLYDSEEWEDEYFDGFLEFDFEDEDLEGEEWKRLVEDDMSSEWVELNEHYLYRDSRRIAALLIEKARRMNSEHYNTTFLRFVEAMLKSTTKIVAGHTLGFEKTLLGGNLVYHKKALQWTNHALKLLHQMRADSIFDDSFFLQIHESVFELRNELGIYVQELRERF